VSAPIDLTRRYDAIVVGARAAGASTAMLLARAGLDVLVVDRSQYGADTISTHALMRGAVMQLRRWGLLDTIIAAGTPAVRRATFHCNGDTNTVAIAPAHGTDALYAPRRTVLDPLLVDAARYAGADVRYGVRIADLCRDRSGRVTGAVVRDAHGHRSVVTARIVIGADGPASTVAALAGAAAVRTAGASGAYVYGYWRDVEADGYEWIFRSGTPLARAARPAGSSAGVIPTGGGLVCAFAGTSSLHAVTLLKGGRDAYLAAVRHGSARVAERLVAGTPIGRLRVFRGRRGHVRRAWGRGWALVGDAGYWKDPLSAHGLTDALRDAELLAREVIGALGSDEMPDDGLARYESKRDRLSSELWDVSEELATHAWSPDGLPLLLRRLSASMADEVTALAELDVAPARGRQPACL
jgi:2-polyprenyl-6-methoxyphenol hydroxylase-like FAD-dependent oxidoreductase